jgi:hypothetical protein
VSSKITYRYVYMMDIAAFTLQTLRDRSPVGTDKHAGLYRDSHILFVDGHNVPDPTNFRWKPGQDLEFSNEVPYARKIELGTIRVSAPPHVYEGTAPIVAAKYGNSVNVRFVFMPVRFGSVQDYAKSLVGRAAGKRRGGDLRARRDWLVRQPALIITAR